MNRGYNVENVEQTADAAHASITEHHGENVGEVAREYARTLAHVARYCLGALDEMIEQGVFDPEGLTSDLDYFEENDPHRDALDALRQLTDGLLDDDGYFIE